MLDSHADSPPPDDEERGGIAGGLNEGAYRGCLIAVGGLALMLLAFWAMLAFAD